MPEHITLWWLSYGELYLYYHAALREDADYTIAQLDTDTES